MRKLHLADDLKVTFSGRTADFDEGFEVGMVAVMMSLKETQFSRTVSHPSIAQLALLSEKLGYHIIETCEREDGVSCTFRLRRSTPVLRLVTV